MEKHVLVVSISNQKPIVLVVEEELQSPSHFDVIGVDHGRVVRHVAWVHHLHLGVRLHGLTTESWRRIVVPHHWAWHLRSLHEMLTAHVLRLRWQ